MFLINLKFVIFLVEWKDYDALKIALNLWLMRCLVTTKLIWWLILSWRVSSLTFTKLQLKDGVKINHREYWILRNENNRNKPLANTTELVLNV